MKNSHNPFVFLLSLSILIVGCQAGGGGPTSIVSEETPPAPDAPVISGILPSVVPTETTVGASPIKIVKTENQLQCRVTKLPGTPSGDFQNCGTVQGSDVLLDPQTIAPGAVSGAHTIELKYEGSPVLSKRIYLHESLRGSAACPSAVSDQSVLTKAEEFLSLTGTFGGDTSLEAPFYSIRLADNSLLEFQSLRRHFFSNTNNTLIGLRRAYESRTNGGCQNRVITGIKRSTTGKDRQLIDCPYLVFNAQGAGVCLSESGGTLNFVRSITHVGAKLAGAKTTKIFSQKTTDPAAESDIVIYLPE